MKVRLKWSVEVNATQPVDNIVEFSTDALRGLIASEMVPEGARIASVNEGFGGLGYCVVRWDTESEMETTENYKAS